MARFENRPALIWRLRKVLLKAFRPAGPALQFKFPTSTEIILDRSIGNQTQVILVMGPPGVAGVAGSTAGTVETFIFPVTFVGVQNIVLNRPAAAGILFINGLMQNPAYYTLLNVNLTVPTDMGVQPGDVISFTY